MCLHQQNPSKDQQMIFHWEKACYKKLSSNLN